MKQLGSRVLRRGMQGPDVAQLQKKLLDRGFDPGPPNGVFGWLTFEALRQYQRSASLQVDGVAGRQVFTFLLQDPPLSHRQIHRVGQGESLAQILRKYNLRYEALATSNSSQVLSRLYEGQELVLPARLVLAYLPPDDQGGLRSLLWHHRSFSGIASPWFHLNDQGRLEGSIPLEMVNVAEERNLFLFPVITNRWNGSYAGRNFRLACRGRKNRRQLLDQLASILAQEVVGGLIFDFRRLAWGDARYLSYLAAGLSRGEKFLYLTLGVHDMQGGQIRPLWGDNYLVLADLFDGLILRFQDEERPRAGPVFDEGEASRYIRSLVKLIPGWKLILYLPTYGWLWRQVVKRPFGPLWVQERWVEPQLLTYGQITQLLQKYRVRGAGKTQHDVPMEDGLSRLWLETGRSLADKALLVNKYGLAGVAVWALGWEDGRLWKRLGQNHLVIKRTAGNKC
ncbi:MAG: peptidoglycan-binding protein [Limnochordia bacterium]